jgi:PAN domain
MRNTFKALAVSLAFASSPQLATAETTDYGSIVHHDELPRVLFLLGQIESGDSFELRRAMRNHEIELVVTASPGGNLYEGLQIASILHDKNVSTYIPENASCESSCANIFLGGRNRMVLGELGVHQFYSSGEHAAAQGRKDVTTSATQYTTSEIIGIMNEFDTPPFVYEKMFGTDEIYYFRGSDKLKLSRGGDDGKFLKLMSDVDDFIFSNPSAILRPAKKSNPTIAEVPPATSGIPTTTSNPNTSNRYTDLDFFGMDLDSKGIKNVSLGQCESYCKKSSQCAAYSYVSETRWCWPKSGVENISLANGVISGVVDYTRVNLEAFERPFREATAIDIPGYDIFPQGLKNMSLNQCRHACQATHNCAGFSWVAKKSWCFPKYGVGQLTESLGIISGVKK